MKKWLWKILLIPAVLIFIFGAIGLIYPYLYIDFYLGSSVNTPSETYNLLSVIFRANGLGMVMSSILALFIISVPFRKGERWAVIALSIVGIIGLTGEVILEVMVL